MFCILTNYVLFHVECTVFISNQIRFWQLMTNKWNIFIAKSLCIVLWEKDSASGDSSLSLALTAVHNSVINSPSHFHVTQLRSWTQAKFPRAHRPGPGSREGQSLDSKFPGITAARTKQSIRSGSDHRFNSHGIAGPDQAADWVQRLNRPG
jgi:hypothetical protein